MQERRVEVASNSISPRCGAGTRPNVACFRSGNVAGAPDAAEARGIDEGTILFVPMTVDGWSVRPPPLVQRPSRPMRASWQPRCPLFFVWNGKTIFRAPPSCSDGMTNGKGRSQSAAERTSPGCSGPARVANIGGQRGKGNGRRIRTPHAGSRSASRSRAVLAEAPLHGVPPPAHLRETTFCDGAGGPTAVLRTPPAAFGCTVRRPERRSK